MKFVIESYWKKQTRNVLSWHFCFKIEQLKKKQLTMLNKTKKYSSYKNEMIQNNKICLQRSIIE